MDASTRPAWMNESHEALGDSARRFVREAITPNDLRWRAQHRVDTSAWRQAGELGLLLTDVPADYGGMDGDFGHEVAILRALAESPEMGFAAGRMVHAIVAHYLLACGTEAQKQQWLPKMAAGTSIGAIAMTEPGAGSDLKGIRTTAVLDGDHYVVNGSKTYISNALNMGLLVLVAKTDPAAGSKGVSLLLLDAHATPGFRCGAVLDKMGMHAQDTCELFFDGCRVPADQVLGGVEGRGMYQLMEQLPYERALIAVYSAAVMAQAVALAVDWCRQRQAFGKPLIELQNARFQLAEASTRAAVARVFVDDVVRRRLDGTLDGVTASMAKWWVTQTHGEVVDACLQLFGGAGYMNEFPIARMYTDARVMRIFGGTNEIMKELIARAL
ncbi:MAG TPA: acyl-CoA dehydrogenase family protein [Burkholderiaceae bacterium]